jgi:hypothetical protein
LFHDFLWGNGTSKPQFRAVALVCYSSLFRNPYIAAMSSWRATDGAHAMAVAVIRRHSP